MRTLIEQWAPRKAYLHWQLPTGNSDSWSPTNSVVARYIAQLELLGLGDPTKATDFYNQALQFQQAYLDLASKQNGEVDLSERLVRGEITIDDATKQAAKAPAALDARQRLERQRQVISNAIASSYSAAVRAVHNFGEINWLGPATAAHSGGVRSQESGPLGSASQVRSAPPGPGPRQGLAYLALTPDLHKGVRRDMALHRREA